MTEAIKIMIDSMIVDKIAQSNNLQEKISRLTQPTTVNWNNIDIDSIK